MKRLPRKVKKIAKNCLYYGTTDFYYHVIGKLPKNGIVFIRLTNHSPWAKHIILFGKKIREAYIDGMFDF